MVGGREDERTNRVSGRAAIRWCCVFWGIGRGLCNTFPSPEERPFAACGIAFVSPSLINHTHTWLSAVLSVLSEYSRRTQRVTSDPPVSHVAWRLQLFNCNARGKVRNGS
jgi:hypothetical protein